MSEAGARRRGPGQGQEREGFHSHSVCDNHGASNRRADDQVVRDKLEQMLRIVAGRQARCWRIANVGVGGGKRDGLWRSLRPKLHQGITISLLYASASLCGDTYVLASSADDIAIPHWRRTIVHVHVSLILEPGWRPPSAATGFQSFSRPKWASRSTCIGGFLTLAQSP